VLVLGIIVVAFSGVFGAGACGESSTAAPPASPSAPPDGGAHATDGDAAAAPRPFAGSVAEATELISQAIDKRSPDVRKCVDGYRARKNSPHERVDIAVGIDQEGTLLGATLPHGRKDDAFSACVMDALRPALFPRSHSGVISVTKSYEEFAQ
jgi:hypothetical protein